MRAKLVAGAVVLAFAAVLAVVRLGGLRGEAPDASSRPRPAPALAGIAGWINGEPVAIAGLAGRVVLLDFWTYSCVNCVRTFPFLRALHDRYAAAGLRVIGVHSPEFAFERDAGNVRAAAARHMLPYPIALDSDMQTWRAYRNTYWPRVYVIDASGQIRFDHIGEGGEDRIEGAVRDLLAETGATLPPPIRFRERGPSAQITPEVYAGFERGSVQGALGNVEGYRPEQVVDYAPVDAAAVERAGTQGTFFLEGRWRAEREYVEAASDGARVVLPFRARDVFFVGAPGTGAPTVRALLDGRAPGDGGGSDGDGSDGEGPGDPGVTRAIVVDRSDLFQVVELERAETHVLTLEVDRGFRLYTFTFG